MKHLDLFSGIGGFALAAEMVWDNVEHTFCDIEPFSQEVLKKHWPNSKIYGDIKTLTGEVGRHQTDILTGGFPCQPFSVAGKRRGTEDDRHLWPEMLRVIREFRPRWIIGENVGGLASWSGGLVLEQIHTDLEGEGYSVQAFIIPAVSVNAPHRRDRIWIVAHAESERTRGGQGEVRAKERGQVDEHIPHPGRKYGKQGRGKGLGKNEGIGTPQAAEIERHSEAHASNAKRTGYKGKKHKAGQGARHSGRAQQEGWNQNWPEVAARLCRMDDGIPADVDRTRLMEYICKYGSERESQIAKESTEGDKTNLLRLMRVYIKVAETSLQRFAPVVESSSALPKVPHGGGYEKRQVGSWQKEAKKMRDLQSLVSSSRSHKDVQDLLAEMPITIGEAQRYVALASQRNPRLKALGNAIVPQVAAEIFKAIKWVDEFVAHPQSTK